MPQLVRHERVYPTDSRSRKGIFSNEYGILCEIGLSIQGSPKKLMYFDKKKNTTQNAFCKFYIFQIIKMRQNVNLIFISVIFKMFS